MATWGDRLREEIKLQRIKVRELADRTNISRSLISKYQNNRAANPRGNNLEDLAGALGINVEWLRYGTGSKFREPSSDGNDSLTSRSDAGKAGNQQPATPEAKLNEEIAKVWVAIRGLQAQLDRMHDTEETPRRPQIKGPEITES